MEVGGSSTGSVRGSYASQGPVDRSVLVLQANHKSDLFKDFVSILHFQIKYLRVSFNILKLI